MRTDAQIGAVVADVAKLHPSDSLTAMRECVRLLSPAEMARVVGWARATHARRIAEAEARRDKRAIQAQNTRHQRFEAELSEARGIAFA